MQLAQAHKHRLVQGDRMIVKTYQLGNTVVHIADDYMVSGQKLAQMNEEIAEANYAIWDSLSEEEQLEVIRESA